MRGTTLQTPRPVKKEGRRCSRCRSRGSPAAQGADHGEAGCALQPMEVHGGAEIHPQPMEDPTPEQGMLEGGCNPMGSLHWIRLLPGPVDLWREEPMLEQVCRQGL